MSYRIEKIIERKSRSLVTRVIMTADREWMDDETLEAVARQDLEGMEERGGFIVVQHTKGGSNEIAINI